MPYAEPKLLYASVKSEANSMAFLKCSIAFNGSLIRNSFNPIVFSQIGHVLSHFREQLSPRHRISPESSLQTPLFRVRNKKETRYCYTEEERLAAIERLSPNPEITRFKGLGEISPDEFVHFIGPEMRLEPVTLHKSDKVKELLEYYMGKNTMERQNFIIDNLVVEEDLAEEDAE